MRRLLALLASVLVGLGPTPVLAEPSSFRVDSEFYRLTNGLRVVLAPAREAPTVTVGVYYGVGFRVEPRGRTGFAHLFEHLMFQESANLERGEFFNTIAAAGGYMSGSTRFDFTRYWEVAPSNLLEFMLWSEADRMGRPVITEDALSSEKAVVANEVRGALHNQPYGGWTWLDLPQAANQNWHNAHNFYGDLSDIEAATVEDARAFHEAYYAPSNAVVVIAGDFDLALAKGWIDRYFGQLRAAPPILVPDTTEPPQTAPRQVIKTDRLATRPAWVAGWRMPERRTPEWYAMGLLDQILAQGPDSRLHRELVQSGLGSRLEAGINVVLGDMFSYRGPMLWSVGVVHDAETSSDTVTSRVESELQDLRENPVSETELERARTKLLMSLYNEVGSNTRLGLVELLAVHALFDNDPSTVNELEAGFKAVTPALIRQTARNYLVPENRTVLVIEPASTTASQ